MKRLFSAILLAMLSFVGVMAQDTWTVAGAAAALNGNDDWSPTNSENDMITTDNENYTLTVTNCTLEQGVTYEYKVVKNHAWDEAYPSSNEKFSVDETAAYTVVYTFNASTHEVGQTTTKTGEAGDITHAYTVAGDFTPKDEALEYEGIPFFGSEWDINDANNNMVSEDGVVYTLTKDGISLYAGTYEYKVVVDHSWGVAYPAANASFYVEADGEYNVVISFNATTKEVNAEVTAVEKPLVIESMSIVGELTGGWPTEEDWSMAKAMVQDPDNPNIWSLTLENVELEAGSYNYKATANGKWGDYELPSSGNQVCQIDEAGTFHLTFTANTESHELTLIADRQATYADLLTLPGDETYTEGKFFMVEAADEASGNIRLTAGETVLNEIMEDGTAMIEITNAAFTSGEFTISADKELTLTKVSLFEDPDAAEGIQIWPEVAQPVVIESMSIIGELTGGWPTEEDWSMAKAMTQDSDHENLWTLTVEGVEVEAKKYEYKAVANGKYGDYELPASGNNDFVFGTDEYPAGTYNLTFTANTESHELTLIADRQATYADLLTLPGDETYTEGKFFMVEAADEASGNIRLTAGETVLNEIMEDGTAMIEITNAAFTSGEFTISADKELTLTKVSLFDDPDAAEGIQIWPEVNPENAVIASVDIRGEFNGWSGGQNMLELTAENTYTGVLDLTDIAYDQEFKLVVNAEGGNGDIWIGTNQLTLDVPEGWVAADGQGNNFKLLNSTTGYQSYTFTANWTASPDAAAGWTLKIEGKDVREVEIPDAVITNVEIRGAFNDWTAGVNVLEPTDAENVYEGTIDLTATQDDQEFKLVVNAEGVENDIWIGNGSDTQFNTTEGWIVGLEEGNWNYVLKNSITGFQTYTVKAAWTPSTDAGKGWTLTISGKDQRIATGIEAWRTEFEDGHYYNLQGVRITNPKRGVYIHNGQKIVVK